MSQKLFQTMLKSLFKGDQIDAQAFWLALQEQNYEDNAAQFSLQMFENITNPKRKLNIEQNLQKIYATMLALEYYKNRKPKSQSVMDDCQRYLQKNALGSAKWVLSLFSSPVKDSQFTEYFMSRIVLAPKNINQDINFEVQLHRQQRQVDQFLARRKQITQMNEFPYCKIKKMSFFTQIRPQSKAITFSYICFLDCVRTRNNQLQLKQYEQILIILKALLNSLKTNNQCFYYMCIFLHFIINCLTFYSCASEMILKQLMVLTNQIRNCWGMVGQIGNQLFDLIIKQMKIPGSAFRKKLKRDFPSLDIKQSTFLNKQFYLVTECQDCFSFPQDRSLTNMRKLIIWHVLKICEVEQQQFNEFIKILRAFSIDSTYLIYFKTMRIIDICQQMEVFDKIKITIKQHMLTLLEEIRKRVKIDTKKATQMEMQEFDTLIQQQNHFNIFRYPMYEIIHVPLHQFVNMKSKMSFFSVLNKFRSEQPKMTFYSNAIQIVFYGNSYQFWSLVQILSKFIQQADISEFRQLEVYYLPKHELSFSQDIASYISSKDIWYRRFVNNVFKEKVLFPHLELKSSNKNLFPSYLANKTLHMYLRQAKRIFYLRVYRCTLKTTQTQEPIKIYFTSHLMMGMFAQAEFTRLSKINTKDKSQKYEQRDAIQIIKQKLQKRHTVMVADIQIQELQTMTNLSKKIVEKNLKFEDLQICNMPKHYFMGGKPDPSVPGLKLSILPQSNSKLFWKQVNNNENFRENKTSQEINMAFRDIFINYTIKGMRLRAGNSDILFKVIVDGRSYSKVYGVDIESPITTNGLPLCIPIYTFLPFK